MLGRRSANRRSKNTDDETSDALMRKSEHVFLQGGWIPFKISVAVLR